MNAEQYLAKSLVGWLTSEGWEVYQEVTTGCGRTDIVGVKNGIRWGIEVKTSLNMAVMDQARTNRRYYHYSSIAVPAPKNGYCFGRNWDFTRECGKLFGFGILAMHNYPGTTEYRILQETRPTLNRRVMEVTLYEEQKTFCEAGSSSGGQFTPFRRTAALLADFAKRRPGYALKEAVKDLEHHYANAPSAARSLAEMIRGGVITDVRLENGLLYPVLP